MTARSPDQDDDRAGEGASPPAAEVLVDLPVPLWTPLLQALRRAGDQLGRAALPVALRPYASWRADRLTADRPRRAVAAALADDPRLRQAVGEALDEAVWNAAAEGTATRLASEHGAAVAVAALAARARWQDIALLAADVAGRDATRGRAAADPPADADGATADAPADAGTPGDADAAGDDAPRRQATADRQTRRDRDAARRRADAAEGRLRQAEAEIDRLRGEVATLRREWERLRQRLDEEQRRSRDRLARLRRRADDAESRARVDAGRAGGVADELERLAADLRGALHAGVEQQVEQEVEQDTPRAERVDVPRAERADVPREQRVDVPRRVRGAERGRPCVLPPGLTGDEPQSLQALLQVPGLRMIVDGYNVTLHAAGKPTADLADQRAWLERVAGGVAAQHGVQVTLVFDGAGERTYGYAAARGVRTVFTAEGETADERIAAIVADLDAEEPVVVVSADGQVRQDCLECGANVVGSAVFLQTLT